MRKHLTGPSLAALQGARRAQGLGPDGGGRSLVAAVPLPGVPRPVPEEVRCALVLHTLGETQQHPHVVVRWPRGVGCAVGTGGEIRGEAQSPPARDTPRAVLSLKGSHSRALRCSQGSGLHSSLLAAPSPLRVAGSCSGDALQQGLITTLPEDP